MSLAYSSDPAAAVWLVRSPTPPFQLITFGPVGFAAYARLRYLPDPTAPDQHEADVDMPADHPSDLEQARRALHTLARFTSTPQECWFCVWEGYSDVVLPPAVHLIDLPYRRFALLSGSVADIDGWTGAPPAFVWPADRSWCFTSDVDPHWAGIGGSQAAVDAVIADPGLDAVAARPSEPPVPYR